MLQEPRAPAPLAPRHTALALPPYRFIPGINKHPVRDPQGHSFGREEIKLSFQDPKEWKQNVAYLFGVDLYNNAFWWEAHEAWEAVWHTTDKDSAYGQFLQGLIQIAAAFIKWHSHEGIGMTKLYALGIMRLEFTAKKFPDFMGLDLKMHLEKLKNHFAEVLKGGTWPDAIAGYPFILLG